MLDMFKTAVLLLCFAVVSSGCAKKEPETIPASLIEFKLKSDVRATHFTVLEKTQRGDWITIILERQGFEGDKRYAQIRIACEKQKIIYVRMFKPTLEAMRAEEENRKEESVGDDIFWKELAGAVCSAYSSSKK